jgi:acyl carrier protein
MQLKSEIEALVIEALVENNAEIKSPLLQAPTLDTVLFWKGGVLDSLELVKLISDLEENVFQKFGKQITLADEKAMSLRVSPFRTVNTLVEYINRLLIEKT